MGKLVAAKAMPAPEPPQRSPERAKLAEVIDNIHKSEAELARIQEALERHLNVSIAADQALDAASEQLEKLKANEEAILSAELLGDDGEAKKLRETERAVEEARSAVAQADKVREGLRHRKRAAEEAVAAAESDLRAAHLGALVADPAIASLIARFEKMKFELATLAQVLELTRAAHPAHYFYNQPPDRRELPRDEVDRWNAALAQLREDADTELPS